MVSLKYLNFLTNLILNYHFQSKRCIFFLTDQKSGIETNIPVVVLRNENATFSYELLFKYHGCQGIIINVKKPRPVFDEFEKQIRLHMDRFNQRKYLILSKEEGSEGMLSFFETPLDYVADLLVVVPENVTQSVSFQEAASEEAYSFYTHKYTGNENCSQAVLIAKWSSNSSRQLSLENLYPEKLKEQNGRKLRIATFTYVPSSIPKDPPETSDGIEMKLALEFSKKHNMSVELIVDEHGEWGDLYQNWTGTGIIGSLLSDNADVGFGALYTWEEHYHFLEISKPLVRTGITCLVPAPRLSAGWFVPLFSFSKATWIGVSVSFTTTVLTLFVITVIKRSENSDDPLKTFETVFLKTAASFLLQSLPRRSLPTRKATKCMIATIFLASLLLTSCYNSGLASSMTIPRYDNPINTVDDLVAADIYWGATSTAWITSIECAEEEKIKKLVSNFVVATKEELYLFAIGPTKFAFSVERLPFGNYAIGNYIRQNNVQKFRPMMEDIYWEQYVMMLRKNSVLLPLLNMIILRTAQSGILAYWENRVIAEYSDSKVQEAVKYYIHHHEREIIKLKMKHMEGAFAVLIIGLSCSLVCFILELIVYKYFKRLPFLL